MIDAYDYAIEDANNKAFIIDDMLALMGDDSILGQIKAEVASETIDMVVEYMKSQRDMWMVSMLDNNAVEEEQ